MKKQILFLFALFCCTGIWAEEHYLVGGCTDSGWNAGAWERSAVRAYSADGTTWVWVGKLTVGEGDNGRFKIPDSDNGWDGFWAPEQGTVLTSEWSALSTDGTDDKKFCVTEEGLYKVTFTTGDTKQIKAEKLTEPSKDGEYYLVSSVDDYYWFAAYIATDDTKTAKARLTADLDFSGKTFTPMASDKHKFKGEFDGAGHSIKNAVVIGTYNNVGLFTYLSDGADIHDLIIDATCSFTGNAKVAGIVGHLHDGGEVKLTNIITGATITGVGSSNVNAAGFVGCAEGGTKITALNCANTGKVTGANECAAFCGWSQSGTTFTNCWNSGEISVISGTTQLYRNTTAVSETNCYDLTTIGGQGTKLDAATLATGELCYKLNGDQSSFNWYQNLTGSVDATPVPFSTHSKVYANGTLKCDGTSAGGDLTYSNSSTSGIPPHTDVDGFCSVCGALIADHYSSDTEGFYNIGTDKDLYWFAALVSEKDQSAKAKLTADVDYTAYKQGFIGASQGKAFSGIFDGQEHTITIDIVNNGSDRTGLFAYINAATIKNLVVTGSATSADKNCVGGLGGRSDGDGTLIENVVVKAAVSYTGTNADATCGGFFANMEGQVTLKNCAFLGSINSGTAVGNGGLVGWAGSSSNNKYINCLVAPSEYTKNGNSEELARNNPSTTNCLYVAADDAKLSSGEYCYTLNAGGDNWFQNIGSDATPVPFSSHSKVYANASYNCDGTPKGAVVYANVNEESHDAHVPADGFCTVCSALVSYVADYMTPASDGYYEISDNKQMRWFAYTINNVEPSANARLTADIDFTGIKNYAPIGTEDKRYTGTFDGQGHQITNLVVDLNQDNVGVFGVVAQGTVIKNFTLASSSSIKGNGHVGIVGMIKRNADGEVHLECLGNEASITGTGSNVGGILGVNMLSGSYAKIYMTNCYNTGDIAGNNENGQLTGWSGDNAVLENCYAIGNMTNCDGFARLGGGSSVTNSYCDKELTWNNHPTLVTEDDVKSGKLAYMLNGKNGGTIYYQDAGTGHPVFNPAVGQVFFISDAGYSTAVFSKNVVVPANTVFTATVDGDVVKTAAVDADATVAAGTAVILAGEKSSFISLKPSTAAPATLAANVLKGSFTDDYAVENEGDIYILIKNDEGEAVFARSQAGTLKAGKAYIEKASVASEAPVLRIGGTTGIANTIAMPETNVYYDLMGRRVNQLQQGIYIVNGKKVVVK